MENLEILLSNFKKEKLNYFIYNELNLTKLQIKSSHYYDSKSEKDVEFLKIKDFEEILTPIGTGNILMDYLELGTSLRNVLIITSFNESTGDIVFNFPENALLTESNEESLDKFEALVNYLVAIKNRYNVPKIIIGYESAEDEDNLLIDIDESIQDYNDGIKKILEIQSNS